MTAVNSTCQRGFCSNAHFCI